MFCICTFLLCACATTSRSAAYAPRPPQDVSPLERRLGDNPDDLQVNLTLGDRAIAIGDYLRAEQYFRRAQALGAGPAQVVPRLLKALVSARRYDEALAVCRQQLQASPQDRPTRLVEAALLEALDRAKEAERELDVLVKTRPEDPHPYLALGKLYRDSYHDGARAKEMFEKFLSLAPKDREAEAIRYQLETDTPVQP
jgi:tetratricopeptide (TPR) repeat protein